MMTRMPCSVWRIRLKMTAMTETAPYLTLHVPPDEMVKYIQDLMTLPHGEIAAGSAMALAQRHWGGDTPLARAALLRWGALNLAFQGQTLGNLDRRPGTRSHPSARGLGGGGGHCALGPRQ